MGYKLFTINLVLHHNIEILIFKDNFIFDIFDKAATIVFILG